MDSALQQNQPESRCNVCSSIIAVADEAINFSDQLICANCKSAYFQRIREGVSTKEVKTGVVHRSIAFAWRMPKMLGYWLIMAIIPAFAIRASVMGHSEHLFTICFIAGILV